MADKEIITNWFIQLQTDICNALEKEDGKGKFVTDKWERKEGGGGLTNIIQNGNVLEKGGVLFSAVHGAVPSFLIKDDSSVKSGDTFYATGVSIVIHPISPLVPIIHMNTRYFEMSNGKWWFGGGIDLTPHYVNEQDAKFFHSQLKQACDKHDLHYYEKFKTWADDYFYLPHRNETRGIGGIFFDHLNSGHSKEQIFEFVKDVGKCFAPAYVKLMNVNKIKAYTPGQKHWQLLRRGRYVEFNLIYDKGTKFGLETNGRTESILMSLPATANWAYNYTPKEDSAEFKTLSYLKKGINWV